MPEKKLGKLGIYNITEKTANGKTIYIADNGKVVYSKRFKKYYPNKRYERKEFKSMDSLKKFVNGKIKKFVKSKDKVLKKLPKTLYLIIFNEISTGKQFIKVGFTTKKFVARRFSKEYGYEGYEIDTIIRKVSNMDADKLEGKIKTELNKKKTVKKYRPVLKEFSGYSECYDFTCYGEIVKTFDLIVESSVGGTNRTSYPIRV